MERFRYLSISFVLLFIGSGQVLGMLGYCWDPTNNTGESMRCLSGIAFDQTVSIFIDVRFVKIDNITITGELEITGENGLALFAVVTWTSDLSRYLYGKNKPLTHQS